MDGSVIEKALKSIKKDRSTILLNNLMDKIAGKEELEELFFSNVKNDQELEYFILINRNKVSQLLLKIKDSYKSKKGYKNIIEFMGHSDVNVREYFVNQLGKARTEIFIDFMAWAIIDKQPKVRLAIVKNISKYKGKNSIKILLSILDSADRNIIREISRIFLAKGEGVLSYITHMLPSAMDRTKYNLIDIVEKFITIKSLKVLLEIAKESSEDIRLKAYPAINRVLEKICLEDDISGKKDIMEFLREELSESTISKIDVILQNLLRFKNEGAIYILKDLENRWEHKSEYFDVLRHLRNEDKMYLIEEMLKSHNEEIRHKALVILKRESIKEKDKNYILTYLSDFFIKNGETISSEAKELLKEVILRGKYMDALINMLQSREADYRKSAILLLDLVEYEKIDELLMDFIYIPDIDVRRVVLEIIAKKGGEEYLEFFEKLLDDPDNTIQLRALEEIYKIGSKDANDIIKKSYDNPNKNIREKAHTLLKNSNLRLFVDEFHKYEKNERLTVLRVFEKYDPKLEELFNEKISSLNVEVRKNVIDIIKLLVNKVAYKNIVKVALRDPHKMIRATGVSIVAELEDRDLQLEIINLLNDPDTRVRANVIEALGKNPNQKLMSLLLPLLKESSSSPRIKSNVIIAINGVDTIKAMIELDNLLMSEDEKIRASGVYALGKIQPLDIDSYLEKVFRDPSEKVRKNIIKCFYRLGRTSDIINYITNDTQEIKVYAKKLLQKGSD